MLEFPNPYEGKYIVKYGSKNPTVNSLQPVLTMRFKSYPLVIKHGTGKSPCLMEKLTKFPWPFSMAIVAIARS